MKPVRIGRLAQREVNRALAQSQAKNLAKAAVFRRVLRATFEAISANPQMGAVESSAGDRRVILPHRLPYSVIYMEFPMFIQVVALAHHRRRPGYWTRRLRRP